MSITKTLIICSGVCYFVNAIIKLISIFIFFPFIVTGGKFFSEDTVTGLCVYLNQLHKLNRMLVIDGVIFSGRGETRVSALDAL